MQRSIRSLKGVGEKTEGLFRKLGISTVYDLISYYPRDYDLYKAPMEASQLLAGKIVAVEGRLISSLSMKGQGRKQLVIGKIAVGCQEITVLWFHMPYLRSLIKKGEVYIFRGRLQERGKQLILQQPAYFTLAAYDKLMHTMQPVYSLTAGLSNKTVSKMVALALDTVEAKEWLPEEIVRKYDLCPFDYAIRTIHFPKNVDDFVLARKRLAFEELFLFILRIDALKEKVELLPEYARMKKIRKAEEIMKRLPFSLTNAQMKVWNDIKNDLTGNVPMSRLVQGDVGSGKTIVAFLAMAMAADNGGQAALMAPTEVLAYQHYESLKALLTEEEWEYWSPELLTGSTTAKEKRRIYGDLESGLCKMIIGTHALIQEKVNYQNLSLVITDEQHRFGVRQRELLKEKGEAPHILVMSATPIPRTLAVILYGDLDISVIDELPAERLPIKNCVVDHNYRKKAWKFIYDQVQSGHQAYVICPLVSASESSDGEDVENYQKKLDEFWQGRIKTALLHGKMKPAMKNQIMEAFALGDVQVLVSTTVVEVGVNVPNATVMMVENAERFGLAQLHQLRGRVGRGEAQSYCIFIQTAEDEKTKKRLDILNHSNDGFEIAREDMAQRGPGDLFGVRQNGEMQFSIADIYQDSAILTQASQAADDLKDRLDDPRFLFVRERLRQVSGGENQDIIL